MDSDLCIDAWSQARVTFCEGLTADEARLFSSATVETVIEEAKSPVLNRPSGKILHGAQSVLAAIVPYADALDVISSTAPLILGPLWGGLRVVLHLASEYGEYFDKLLNMFTSIADVLPRFRIYEKLFPTNARLRTNLSRAYLDILRFCTSAKHVFRHKGPSTFYIGVVLRLTWKPFKKEFGTVLEAFRQHQKTIEREAGLSHMLQAADDRKYEQDARTFLQKTQKGQIRARLLRLLSDIPWKAFHRRQQRLRHKGTGLWLQDTNEFRSWIFDAKSSCLSCCGIPGAGKTVLCSSIVDHVQTLDTKPTVAYYYFDYRDEKTMTAIGALGSLIQQILISIPVLPESVEDFLNNIYAYDFTTPISDDLIEALHLTLETFTAPALPTYIFIDGLDECKKEVQDDVLRAVKSLIELPKMIIKIFVSFRDDERISKQLRHFPCIKLLEAQLSGDIVAYVEDTVRGSIENGSLVIQDPQLENEIVGELISKACGMFLWVHFQLVEICDNTQSDSSIRETLQNLPIGLEATYIHIVERIKLQSERQRKISQRILEWVVCAKRPLTILELKEAIFLEPTQKSWDCAHVPGKQSHSSLIQTCLSLVTLDEFDGTVTLAHHTVGTFLNSSRSLHLGGGDTSFLGSAQERIGSICITYLMFSDFEIQGNHLAQSLKGSVDILASANINQTTDVLGIPRIISTPFQILQGHRKQNLKPKIDLAPNLKKYFLLDYIINHWVRHVVESINQHSEIDAPFWNSLRYLALEKQAPFSFRPWNWSGRCQGDSVPHDLAHMRLFDWALEHGYFSLLRLLNTSSNYLTDYISFANTRKERKARIKKAVMRRFENGFSSVAEALVSAVKKANMEVFQLTLGVLPHGVPVDPRCLIYASQNGHLRMVSRLLYFTRGFDPVSTETALRCAIEAGHNRIVRLLLEQTDASTRGIMSTIASKRGNLEVLDHLHRYSQTVLPMDNSGPIPWWVQAQLPFEGVPT